MEFRDLKTQYQNLKDEIDAGIAEVIRSADFISGKKVRELETELAAAVGRKFCISCANGTDALELVLRVWGIGKGDAVFVPSFTFMSTAEVVSLLEARPFFVDINLKTFNIDPNCLKKAIAEVQAEGKYTPKAIIPVDLFGQPADFDAILPIAAEHELKILEDAAQGFGGLIREQAACSFGDASITSFFPAKPLGCYGDGGAIFTDNEEEMRLLRSLCVHGKGREKYENIRIGRNSRLDSIQAAVLLPKLRAFFQYELDAVNHVAELYTSQLKDVVRTPSVQKSYRSSWAQYTILCNDRGQRDNLQKKLKGDGIPSVVYYPCGLHHQRAFAYCGYGENSLPATEAACERVLSLPIHPYLTDDEVCSIAAKIKGYL